MTRFLLIFLSAWLVAACHQRTPMELPNLIIREALKTTGELKISQMATDVEFIPLFLDEKSYISHNAYKYIVGRKFIVIVDRNPPDIFLFDRQGNFLRKIGKCGKGPGEFLGELVVALNDSIQTLFVADNRSKKILLYDLSGVCLREKPYAHFKDKKLDWISGVQVTSDSHYILDHDFTPGPPVVYFDLLIIDNSLEFQRGLNPKTGKDGSLRVTISSPRLVKNGNDFFYWSKGQDTLYQIGTNYELIPRLTFSNPDLKKWDELHNIALSGDVELENILVEKDIGLITGSKSDQYFMLTWEKQNHFAYQVSQKGDCLIQSFPIPALENDLFGYDALFLPGYFNCQDGQLIHILSHSLIEGIEEWSEGRLADCLRSAKVMLPARRDELVKIITQLDENSAPVLMVVKLK